ncbi:MAG: DUF2585 domain-containing protein [Patescibacteria group bacterium]
MLDGYSAPLFILGITGALVAIRLGYWRGRSAAWYVDAVLVFSIIILGAFFEFVMGRVVICQCGYIKLWQGVVASAENSQHISDWYTFSHVIHGFGFYALLWLFARRIPIRVRLAIATAFEVAWEVFENTPMVINRYREVTISWGYYGDSILNSTFDVLAMIFGFWLVSRMPVWLTIALTVIMEVGVAYFIRDNLTLNIIMLVYPAQAILRWQAGG